MVEHVNLPAPLTRCDLMPNWQDPACNVVVTKIYVGGERLDNGWGNSYNGILRRVPPIIPMRYRGHKLHAMTVLCDAKDENTVESILAYYHLRRGCVEYVFDYSDARKDV